jgi:hypothetical protein
MAVRRYRMSTIDLAEALLRFLDTDDSFVATRPIGYAYARTVDIKHPADPLPDRIVEGIDPLARLETSGKMPSPGIRQPEVSARGETGEHTRKVLHPVAAGPGLARDVGASRPAKSRVPTPDR